MIFVAGHSHYRYWWHFYQSSKHYAKAPLNPYNVWYRHPGEGSTSSSGAVLTTYSRKLNTTFFYFSPWGCTCIHCNPWPRLSISHIDFVGASFHSYNLLYKKLSYRREIALQGGLVIAKSGRLKLGDNIYRHYKSIFNHCDAFGQQNNRILWKTQNKGYTPLRSSKVNRKPVCDFLLVITEFFSLDVTAGALRAQIDQISAISLQRG